MSFDSELQRQEHIAQGRPFPPCVHCGQPADRHGGPHPRDGDESAECTGYDADTAVMHDEPCPHQSDAAREACYRCNPLTFALISRACLVGVHDTCDRTTGLSQPCQCSCGHSGARGLLQMMPPSPAERARYEAPHDCAYPPEPDPDDPAAAEWRCPVCGRVWDRHVNAWYVARED